MRTWQKCKTKVTPPGIFYFPTCGWQKKKTVLTNAQNKTTNASQNKLSTRAIDDIAWRKTQTSRELTEKNNMKQKRAYQI